MAKEFQRHFRKVHNAKYTGHPVYVFDEDGKDFLVLGITKSRETDGILNIPLTKDPEPKKAKKQAQKEVQTEVQAEAQEEKQDGETEKEQEAEKSYLRPKVERLRKGVSSVVQKGWSFSRKDKKTVSDLIADYKGNKKRK